MDATSWMLFIVFALIAVLSPGPAILLAISNSIGHGMRAVIFSTLGNQLGLLLVSSVAILGLGAALKTSTILFMIIKVVGAAYLIYLGIQQWRSHKQLFVSAGETSSSIKTKKDGVAFMQGLLIAITNPKAILFFTALFPQFVNLDKPVASQFILLIITFTSLSAAALIIYGLLARQAKKWLNTAKRAQWFNRLFGGLFVLLGLGLLRLNHQH